MLRSVVNIIGNLIKFKKKYIYLGALDADDAIEVSRRVVKEGDGDRGGARGHPGAFRLRIYVEHVRFTRKDRLFPEKIYIKSGDNK